MMKKITLTHLSFFVFVLSMSLSFSQSKTPKSQQRQQLTEQNQRVFEQTGVIRCYSVEHLNAQRTRYEAAQTDAEFEAWLAPKVEAIKADLIANPNRRVVQTLPMVFHIFTDGSGPDNVSEALIQAQVDQLNIDYRNAAGSPFTQAADVELEFCLAQQAPDGSNMQEPGINRVTTYGDGPFSTTTIENTMKSPTQWDPTRYINIWVAPITGGILGYADWPTSSGLSGVPAPNGGPTQDGVVILNTSVGSIANPNPNGTQYASGRTLTHELGHWLGLRHTWGDPNTAQGEQGCDVDDYCGDTPNSGSANYTGSPCTYPGPNSCGSGSSDSPDMFQNYMDYSDDTCMNTFTADQKARVLAVMANSPRRMELTSSNVCSPSTTPLIRFGATTTSPGDIMEGSDCNYQDFTIDLEITTAPSANATATLTAAGTATNNGDYQLLNNSVTFASGSTSASNAITLRVFNDSYIEGDETIELSIDVSTSGDAIASSATYQATIINDDEAVTSSSDIDYFFDDFNDEDVSDWTMIDSDGDGNDWGDLFQINNNAGDPVTPVSLISRSWQGSALMPDNWAISPAIDLSTASGTLTLSWITQVAAASWDEEKYSVHVGTSNTVAGLLAAPVSMTETLGDAGNTGTPVDHTLDVSSLAGQTVYIGLRHWDCTDQDFLSLDDLRLSGSASVAVQTAVNTATPDQINITGADTSIMYSTDPTSSNIMAAITATTNTNLGCTSVAVSRDAASAGGAAVSYNGGTDAAGFVLAKTFTLTPAQEASSTYTLNFYFTEAEMSAWETATGNSRNDLYVKNDDTGVINSVALSAFGSDLVGQVNYTGELGGTYYFGTEMALLSTTSFELANSITIFPNPVNDVLNIKVSSGNTPDALSVYNILGQAIISKRIANENDTTVNTSTLPNGMYFIKISKDGGTLTLPFVKK